MKLPFKVDLADKVAVITGAGGVICSEFARALAECGAKVALLDIDAASAKAVADSIGDGAIAIGCDCLNKADIERARDEVHAAFGEVNFLVNGAGGNNPRATTDNEYMTPDLSGVKDFFALEESGIRFVFDLNITSAFLVTQVFAKDMVKTGGGIVNISSMNAFTPLTKIPAYSAAKAASPTSRSGSRCTSRPAAYAATPSRPGFSSPNRTKVCFSTPTAPRRRVRARSLPRLPCASSAR